MAYEFPKKLLRPQEVIDPDNLTQELAPAADQLSGKLNANNFDPFLEVKQDEYGVGYEPYVDMTFTYRWIEADAAKTGETYPRMANIARVDGGLPLGQPAQPNYLGMHQRHTGPVIDSASWVTLLSKDLGYLDRPMRLWVSCIGQYHWAVYQNPYLDSWNMYFPGHYFQYGEMAPRSEEGTSGPTPVTTALTDYPKKVFSALVQFAVRINGTVVTSSITGSQNPQQKAVVPIQHEFDRLATANDMFPGPAGETTPQRSALGVAAYPSRFGCMFDAPPGQCTVELVARRLDDSRYRKAYGARDSRDKISTGNTSMIIAKLPTGLGSAPDHTSVEIPAFSDQETLSKESMYTSRLGVIESTLGNIRQGNLAPGALRPEHLDWHGAVVAHGSTTLSAKSDTGFSGFQYRNRRPDMGYHEYFLSDGVNILNPNKPPIQRSAGDFNGGSYDSSGWCMWGVRDIAPPSFDGLFEGADDSSAAALDEFDALLTDHDKEILYIEIPGLEAITGESSETPYDIIRDDPRVTRTGNSTATRILDMGDFDWEDPKKAFACLNQEFTFKKGINRTLIITADAQVLALSGSTPQERFGSTGMVHRKSAYYNSGIFGFFRIGYHKKGAASDDWTILGRSEVFVNNFNNWRQHPTDEDTTTYGWGDYRKCASHANVSLQVAINRPWYEDEGGTIAEKRKTMTGAFNAVFGSDVPDFDIDDSLTNDYVIDGIALFVANGENFMIEGGHLGLSSATLSAVMLENVI